MQQALKSVIFGILPGGPGGSDHGVHHACQQHRLAQGSIARQGMPLDISHCTARQAWRWFHLRIRAELSQCQRSVLFSDQTIVCVPLCVCDASTWQSCHAISSAMQVIQSRPRNAAVHVSVLDARSWAWIWAGCSAYEACRISGTSTIAASTSEM